MMIDKKLLQQAIQVLRDVNEKHYGDSSKKKPLLEDEKETTLYLQFSLKKIPKCKSIQMIKVQLPHSLLKDDNEVCLITGDLDKRNHKAEIEPDILHYKELIKKHGIDNISEVLTLRQLRTEYKPYEAKQKLLAAYDVFLADRKIAECLPKVLGRHFFKKRKFPIQITVNTPNLKQQVENALSTKVFYLTGRGNCCNSEVAYLDMKDTEISENVKAMANAFCDKLPGNWDNVMGIYLKTSLSKAIPVYMSYGDPNEVHLNEQKVAISYEIDELSTCPDKLVKVFKDGRVQIVGDKRMDEIETEICERTKISKKSTNENIEENPMNEASENVTSTKLKGKKAKNSEKSMSENKNEENSMNEANENITRSTLKGEKDKISRKSTIENKKEGNPMNEANKHVKNSKFKGKKAKMSRKSMSENKDESNSMNEANENVTSFTLKEELPKVIKKEKREEISLNDANGGITYSPAQAVKKEKNEENLKRQYSVKKELSKVIKKEKRKREESMLSDANRSITYSPAQVVKKEKKVKKIKKDNIQ